MTDSGEEGLSMLRACKPPMVLLGAHLPDMIGLEILKRLQQELPQSKTILFSTHQDMNTTIQAMKLGAYDYVLEDIDLEELDHKIQKAIRVLTLNEKISPLKEPESFSLPGFTLIGQSKAMRDIYKFIGMISNTTASVGIRGETGTGKKLMAQVIHQNSPNGEGPFVTVDCTTIVETLSESTLYGHEKGSFTGAIESQRGLFEMAAEGTIFLDEIADLPLSMQGKLLRFLAGQRISSHRRDLTKKIQCPDRCGHQPGPLSGHRPGEVPEGPLLPAESPDRLYPTPAGTS